MSNLFPLPMSYHLDANDRICRVDDNFLEFGKENGYRFMSRETVTGKSIWDFIGDQETRLIYKTIYAAVRGRGTSRTVRFRGDASDLRRELELKISLDKDNGLFHECRTLQVTARPAVPILQPLTGRASVMLTLCSWCKRVKQGPQQWVEVEKSSKSFALFKGAAQPKLVHSICEECRSRQALQNTDLAA